MLRSKVTMWALSLLVTPLTIKGYPNYVKLLPNGGDVPGVSNLGHLDPAGETGLNDFGEAFSATSAWTASFCQEDTDGDGYTNGQELGDPCCAWTESNPVGLITDGISDPTDVAKIPTNSDLLLKCASGGAVISASSGSMADVVGTVSAAGPKKMGGMPPDDDEDDSSESAVISAGTCIPAINSMGLVLIVAMAVA